MENFIRLQDADKFTEFVKNNKKEISVRIVESIKEAIKEQKKEATVFEVLFEDVGDTHLFYYEEDVWIELLQNILEDLKVHTSYSDTVIDAYELIKELGSNK